MLQGAHYDIPGGNGVKCLQCDGHHAFFVVCTIINFSWKKYYHYIDLDSRVWGERWPRDTKVVAYEGKTLNSTGVRNRWSTFSKSTSDWIRMKQTWAFECEWCASVISKYGPPWVISHFLQNFYELSESKQLHKSGNFNLLFVGKQWEWTKARDSWTIHLPHSEEQKRGGHRCVCYTSAYSQASLTAPGSIYPPHLWMRWAQVLQHMVFREEKVLK